MPPPRPRHSSIPKQPSTFFTMAAGKNPPDMRNVDNPIFEEDEDDLNSANRLELHPYLKEHTEQNKEFYTNLHKQSLWKREPSGGK